MKDQSSNLDRAKIEDKCQSIVTDLIKDLNLQKRADFEDVLKQLDALVWPKEDLIKFYLRLILDKPESDQKLLWEDFFPVKNDILNNQDMVDVLKTINDLCSQGKWRYSNGDPAPSDESICCALFPKDNYSIDPNSAVYFYSSKIIVFSQKMLYSGNKEYH